MSTLSDVSSDEPWFVAQGEWHGQPVMIRARDGLLANASAANFPIRVVIEWACSSPHSSGLPSEADYSQISAFEEAVVNFLCEGAILAFVVTHSGSVTYNFYTSDEDWFLERLNEALSDKSVVPITLSAYNDADWSEYRSLLEGCGREDPSVA